MLSLPSPVQSAALLIGRLGLGVILIAHGWQKFVTWGVNGTAEAFAEMGIPLPTVSATIAASVELVGGVLLLVGIATTIAGLVVAVEMLAAIALVHIQNGVFVEDNGWELAGAIGVAALILAAAGAGRYSVDNALTRRREPAARHGAAVQ